MRETCIECTVKHIGSALVLLSETLHGYDDHLILAIGELEQAVQECEIGEPLLSEKIRDVRKYITTEVPKALLRRSGENGGQLLEEISDRLSDLRRDAMGSLMSASADGVDIAPSDNV